VRCSLEASALPVDLILECSAEPSVLAGYTSPGYVLQTNLIGTINCLELARQTEADFIFLSTSRVYPIAYLNQLNYTETDTRFQLSDQQDLPGVSAFGISEQFPLDLPRSLYGSTKLASELIINEYGDAYDSKGRLLMWGVGKIFPCLFTKPQNYVKKSRAIIS